MMIVEPKIVQPIEPNEELIDLFNSFGQPIQLNRSRSDQGAIEVQRSLVKH